LIQSASSLLPSFSGGLHDISGNVGNVIVSETSSESRHGVLAVGYLVDDGLFISASRKVLLKGFLLKSLVGHDHILSTGVAGSAVGVEDGFSSVDVGSQNRLDSGGSDNGGSSSTLSSLCRQV